jgi:hypothetical protein
MQDPFRTAHRCRSGRGGAGVWPALIRTSSSTPTPSPTRTAASTRSTACGSTTRFAATRMRSNQVANPRMPPRQMQPGTRLAFPYCCYTASARRCSPGAVSCARSPASSSPRFLHSTGRPLVSPPGPAGPTMTRSLSILTPWRSRSWPRWHSSTTLGRRRPSLSGTHMCISLSSLCAIVHCLVRGKKK